MIGVFFRRPLKASSYHNPHYFWSPCNVVVMCSKIRGSLRFVESNRLSFLFLGLIVLDSLRCYCFIYILLVLRTLVFLPLVLLLRIYMFLFMSRSLKFGISTLDFKIFPGQITYPSSTLWYCLLVVDRWSGKHASVISLALAIVIRIGCNGSCSFDCCWRLAEL